MINVSVIVAVHNAGKYLRPCLESILSQSETGIELICVDDASNDASPQVLAEVAAQDRRVRLLANDQNSGPGLTRNRGLELARGEYVLFFDADDLMEPTALADLLAIARRDGVPLVRGQCQVLDGTSQSPFLSVPARSKIHFSDERALWVPWLTQLWLIERAFLDASEIRFRPLRGGEDAIFITTMMLAAPRLSVSSRPSYVWRLTADRHDGMRPGFLQQRIDDAAVSAVAVRDMLVEHGLRACWDEVYAPWLLGHVRGMRRWADWTERDYQRVYSRIVQALPEFALVRATIDTDELTAVVADLKARVAELEARAEGLPAPEVARQGGLIGAASQFVRGVLGRAHGRS